MTGNGLCQCCKDKEDCKDHRIDVTINRYVKGKMPPDGNWAAYHSAFERISTTARGLAVEIYKGYSFCPLYKGEHRRKENFAGAHHIALDFDTEDKRSSLDFLAKQPLIDNFASFAYTTPSHTDERPKARVVWVFDAPITDLDDYETLYKMLLSELSWADQSAKDALRLFFGSTTCTVWANWSIFPKGARDYYVREYLDSLPDPEPEPETIEIESNGDFTNYVKAALESECDLIRQAADGQRHRARFQSAISVGNLVGANWANLDKTTALNHLLRAAKSNSGTPEHALERVLLDGLERGIAEPRDKPVRTVELKRV